MLKIYNFQETTSSMIVEMPQRSKLPNKFTYYGLSTTIHKQTSGH